MEEKQRLSACQKIIIDQGALYLGESNALTSIGYLELNPHTSLTLHNRPAKENLTQIKGKSVIVIFDEEKGRTHLLSEGDMLSMLPNTWHIHTNPFNEPSLTQWYFEGDISDIINKIRDLA